MPTKASRDVHTMGGGDKEHEFELPALKLAQLLNCRDIELEGLGIEYVNTKAEDGESTFHAALIAEVIDGRTVDCVPLTSCEDLDSRVDDEEARKVPSVILSLKVPSKTYVDLESPPQSKVGYVSRGVRDVEARQFQLAGITVPKAKLDDTPVTSVGGSSSSRSYGSEHLDAAGEPLGVAAAASLADLVLGRVVLLQVLRTDENDNWVGNMLMPVVCDSRVDGEKEAEQLYSCLAKKASRALQTVHELETTEQEASLSSWDRLVTLVKKLILKKGCSASTEILGYFTGAVFDYSTCPPLMAVVSVADVMMQRGLAWLDSVGGEKGIQKPQGGRWGNCRYQHLMALQERARKARQGVWQLRRDVLKDLRLDEEGNLPRFSGEESAFPALLLAQMLQYLSGDNGDGKSTAKEENGGRFFAALVTRVVDGDTVRLAPVLSDEHVHRLMHENERRSIRKLEWAISKSTASIIGTPYYPRSELESWGDGEKSVAVKDADKRFILTTVYAIDTPEVARGGLKPYTGRAVLSVGAHLTYGSEQLDEGGQPLGVAAGRAMSELVLGRVVLVEELGSDCFERLVARIFIPAVSDSLHTGAASHAAFFSLLSTELRCLYIRDFGSVPDLPQCTGVRGVVSIVHRIRKARSGNLQQLLLGCMRRMVYNHIRGLVDASEEMLRRGLARVYHAASVKVEYGGKEQKKRLEELARTAENRGCGMWGLPWWCQEDPKEHRRRTRGDGRFTCNEGKLERRKTCNNILINSCIGGNGNR